MQKNKIIPFSIILTALIVAGIIFASRTDLTVKQTKIFWTEKPENSRGIEFNKFQRPDSLVELAKKEKQAVVNISTTQIDNVYSFHPWDLKKKNQIPFRDFLKKFFEDMPNRNFNRQSLGSGFIISTDGYILTNNHVVENAAKIKVTLSDETEFEAKIVGRDPKTDIALIKIPTTRKLPLAYLGNSDKLEVGEWVIAIGNPFGLAHTVTAGIVSAKGRVIGIGNYDDFIQTDASINPGNSGGPLFNLNGEVVGINTAIVASGQGIGFATPVNIAKEILKSLKEEGKVTRGWLGVSIQPIDYTIAKTFKLKDTSGALVGDVMADTPAEKAGIRRGDVIINFNGKKIVSYHDLPRMVGNTKVGKTVDVTLVREGNLRIFKVKIAELKDNIIMRSSTQVEDRLGLSVKKIDPSESRILNLPSEGVLVEGVRNGSLAEENDIRTGDIILEINKERILGIEDYKKALNKTEGNNYLIMLLRRDGRSFYVSIRLR